MDHGSWPGTERRHRGGAKGGFDIVFDFDRAAELLLATIAGRANASASTGPSCDLCEGR